MNTLLKLVLFLIVWAILTTALFFTSRRFAPKFDTERRFEVVSLASIVLSLIFFAVQMS